MLASDGLFPAFARGTAAKHFRGAQSLERFSFWRIARRITVHDIHGRLVALGICFRLPDALAEIQLLFQDGSVRASRSFAKGRRMQYVGKT
jgi:hypothetical protein